jgi:hypothetical protein
MAKPKKGKFLLEGHSLIIMRNTGQVINHATILEKSFTIDTPDLGTIPVKTVNIQTIIFKNLPTFPVDVIRTVGGTEFNGTITTDPIRVEAEDLGGKKDLPAAKVLSIMF